MDERERYGKGLEVRRTVLGDAHAGQQWRDPGRDQGIADAVRDLLRRARRERRFPYGEGSLRRNGRRQVIL